MLWRQGINWHDYPARFIRGGYFQRRVIAQTFTVEELAQWPPLHEGRTHPDMMIRRSVMVPLELPPLLQVANRVEVIFRGCAPEPLTAPRQATGPSMIRQVGPDTVIVAESMAHTEESMQAGLGHRGPFIACAQAGSTCFYC